MAARVDPPEIGELLASLSPVLEARGFRRSRPPSVWTGKFNIASWSRTTWKTDLFRLGWRKPPISAWFLDVEWSVPSSDGSSRTASGMNPSYNRRGARDRRLPSETVQGGRDSVSEWLTEVLRDAEYGLAWCDSCGTRQGALADMARAERNGPGLGTTAYAYVVDYVRRYAPTE
jgi:hypothetical protein